MQPARPAQPVRSVAIIGTGLIGGSVGLALRSRRPDLHLTGYDSDRAIGPRAAERGAVHVAAANVADAVAEADAVVLATPIAVTMRLLEEVGRHVREGALVTDVASVKHPIVARAAAVLPAGTRFVGGHPMAGAEYGGIENADALLFENAAWVLCPPAGVDLASLPRKFAPLIDLVTSTGARPLLLEAARHDRIAAAVSHLPQLLAVALVNEASSADPAAHDLAAGGFRDMTRIASSPFGMWREILVANHGQVLDVLARFSDRLSRLRYRVAAEAWDEVAEAFEQAHRGRAALPTREKGFLLPLADITVRAEDRPGYLLGMVRALADAGLNIKDVELLKVREGAEGVFRFGFADERDADRAVAVLDSAGYQARRL